MTKIRTSSGREKTFSPWLAPAALALLAAGVASAQTAEQNRSPTLLQIRAPAVQQVGGTGIGVTVAIVDTGILASHPEFAGRVYDGFNALDFSEAPLDGNGHGTHVAGIIGAALDGLGVVGIAYDVRLLPIKVLDDNGFGSDASVARGIRFAARQRRSAKPVAINMSLGGSGPAPTIASALKAAVREDIVVAIAAGNDGDANPEWPARYASESWAKGQIIAVGAVDANNQIANFSNRAGDAKSFFLVAPGVRVLSTYSERGADGSLEPTYVKLSGTSMATPHVTGAVAALKSHWNFLRAPQLASILFLSARDLGAPGVDAVYGRGLLDLEAAIAPIGDLFARTRRGHSLSVNGTSLAASTALRGALLAAADEGRLRMAAFDAFGRDYAVDFGSTLRRAPAGSATLGPLLEAVDAAEQRSYPLLGGTLRIAQRSQSTQLAQGRTQPGRELSWGDGGFWLSHTASDGREWTLGTSEMGARSFGLAGELARRGGAALAAAPGNPYFALAAQHMHVGLGLPLRGGVRAKLGVLLADPRERAAAAQGSELARGQRMGWAELSGGTRRALWSLGVGRLQECNSVLGTAQSGALRFEGRSGTTVASLGLAAFPLERLTVGAQYTFGRTRGARNQTDSLVSGYTASRSDAYSVFAALDSPFVRGDQLSLTLSRPLRTSSGELELRVPVRADENGTPVMESRSLALDSGRRETRADLLYLRPIGENARWFVGVGVRQHPDHDPHAPLDLVLGAGLRWTF